MEANKKAYKRDLIEQHNRRLHVLQLQKAQQGANVRPEVLTEIDDIIGEIQRIEGEIKDIENIDTLVSPNESKHPDFRGLLGFIDDQLLEHVRKLVDMMQINARLQANVEILGDFLQYIDSSEKEADMEIVFAFIRDKMNYVMRFSDFHQCYYILARAAYMNKRYDECAGYISDAIKINDLSEYRYMRAETLYKSGKQNYEKAKDQENINERKTLYLSAKDSTQLAREDLEQSRTFGFSSREIKSLRQDLIDLFGKINENLVIIDLEEAEEQDRLERERMLLDEAQRARLERDQKDDEVLLALQEAEKESEEVKRQESEQDAHEQFGG